MCNLLYHTIVSYSCAKEAGYIEAHLEVYVLASRHVLEVHFQDFLAPLDIRVGHCDMTVKAAWSNEGLVQRLGEIGSSYADHTITRLESAARMTVRQPALAELDWA